jgi:hypothetical protein
MRGWIYHVSGGNTGESRQIRMTAVDNGSPAQGVLAANDVILGANGTGADPAPFASDARKSLALAIAEAEARNPATLKLLRWRSGTTTPVQITLRTLGAYTATAPYLCPKSTQILTEGAQWVFNNETSGRNSFGGLSLLATGNAAYATRVTNEARARVPNATTRAQMMSNTRDATSMITWERGHTLVLLAEYFLATGDTQVLPGIEAYAVNIAKNSSMFGTLGHIFAEKNSDGSPNGPMGGVYGPVNSSGMPCFLGLLLARECGLTNPEIQPAIDRASLFFASYTGRGAIPYGEHEASPSHEGNGRSGLAALCFALQENRVEAGKFFAKMATAAPSERELGHTGAFFNYLWSPLGAAAGGEAAAAEHFKRIAWRLDLARRWNGAFVYDCLNGEGPNSGATYNDFRMSTAALLVYALPLRKLHITGRGHDPARGLSAADVAAAGEADDYDPNIRTTAQLIADTGNWSPKTRRLAAIRLKTQGVTTAQREQLQAIATNPAVSADARAGACDAIGRIANSASAPVLAGLLSDPENRVRHGAAEALRYLPTAARQSVLQQVLVATAQTAKPWLPIDSEDPLQFAHGRLAVLLFYGGSAYGPKGIIWNNLSGVDRSLLYPAIRAVAGSPLGFTRNNLQWTYPMLSEADMRGVAGAVVDSVREVAPSDKMFASAVRQKGFDLMEKYRVSEGVPSGLKYMVEANAGDRTAALQTLERYAASYTSVTPVPDVIAAVTAFLNATGGNAEQNASVKLAAQKVLDAIAADTNPRTLTAFKGIQSVVADHPQLVLPANSTILRVTSFDHAQGDSVYTWKKISGPGAVSFSPNGTSEAATPSVQFDGPSGFYSFEVTMSDSRGLTEARATVPVELSGADGITPPSLVSMVDNVSGGPSLVSTGLTYTVTFDRAIDPATIGPVDFGNGGSAGILIDSVTATGNPAVFEVAVRALSPGDLRLEIVAGATITDLSGAPLDTTAARADDTTISVNAGKIVIDGTAFWRNQSTGVFTGTFDASGSDKLVVILTGEHGFNTNAGTVNSVTYDGVPLIPVIQRNAQVASTDTLFNHIWILDNPATSAGQIAVNVVNRGSVTAFGLSGTSPGAGATAISPNNTRTVDLTITASNSLVIASFGMGGAGNTANVGSVTVALPLTFVSAQFNGSSWDGHVTAYAQVPTAGTGTYSFTGGNETGAYVIAAEFQAAEIPTNSYLIWSSQHPGVDLSDPSADLDGGSLPTGIEWVVGGNPNQASDDAGLTPTLDTTTDPDGKFLFTYRRSHASKLDPNTTLAVEYGDTLGGWTPAVHQGTAAANITITEAPDAPGFSRVTVALPAALADHGKLFVRLKVIVATP